MTCEELRLEYDAYALGIAERREREELEAHLARGCNACTQGIAKARSTVAALSDMVAPVAPPSRLRRQILARVAPCVNGAWLPWATSAAFALALAISVLRPPVVAPVSPELARMEQVMAILRDSVTQDVSFGEPAARGRVFVSPSRGFVLIAAHLPKLAAGKTFQMWVIPAQGNPISAGTFESEADASAIHLRAGPVEGAAAVAVTVEPAGGSPQPTATPFIVTKL